MKKAEYHATKIRPLVQLVARIIKNNPHLVDDMEILMSMVASSVPAMLDKSKCINCGASMAEYVFEFDVLDAILLLTMGKHVRATMTDGWSFTEANKVRTPNLDTTYAIRSRTTQCAKLGIIAKFKGENGKHLPGTWSITRRGWEALRGEAVPKQVRVFRGEILERTDEKITIAEAFRNYGDKIAGRVKKGNKVRTDYRKETEQFDPKEWVHIAGMHEGAII